LRTAALAHRVLVHRVSTVRDRLRGADEGVAVERGDHDTLLALGGHYAELHRLQQIEAELEAS
jgi:ABC-type multidrug transport system fused ATPase/permease subunit